MCDGAHFIKERVIGLQTEAHAAVIKGKLSGVGDEAVLPYLQQPGVGHLTYILIPHEIGDADFGDKVHSIADHRHHLHDGDACALVGKTLHQVKPGGAAADDHGFFAGHIQGEAAIQPLPGFVSGSEPQYGGSGL